MGTKNNPAKYDCLSKAEPDEPYFVLLGRDPSAAFCVTLWASLNREVNGGEAHCEDKCAEALACAEAMQAWALGRGEQGLDKVGEVFFGMIGADGKDWHSRERVYAEVRELVERAARGHDELAKQHPSGPDEVKAAALRRFAEVFLR